jgi:hypothetical protein
MYDRNHPPLRLAISKSPRRFGHVAFFPFKSIKYL